MMIGRPKGRAYKFAGRKVVGQSIFSRKLGRREFFAAQLFKDMERSLK
jgi:hypothetical protein